jgi:replicative DNA helicase
MSSGQLGRRAFARLTKIDATRVRRGSLDPREWAMLAEAAARLAALPIWTSDRPPHEVEGLRSLVQRHRTKHNVRMLVVDYLQLMTGPKGAANRNAEIEHITRSLKRLATELGLHVIALSQLNRGVESRRPPRPALSDLRDSGAIEQDADNVMLLWRPEYYFDDTVPQSKWADWQGMAELILAKQRDGPTDAVRLVWDKERLTFTEQEREHRRAQ